MPNFRKKEYSAPVTGSYLNYIFEMFFFNSVDDV